MLRYKTAPLALLGVVMAMIVWVRWGHWAPDLGAAYFGAKLFSMGSFDHIYSAPDGFLGAVVPDPVWADLAADLGHARDLRLPYVYPPLIAEVLSPLAQALTPIAFFNLALVVDCGVLVWCVVMARSLVMSGPFDLPVWIMVTLGLAVSSIAFPLALSHLQPQIWVTALILGAFLNYKRGHSVLAGGLLSVAVAIKLTPIVFALIFFYDRDWKAALGAFGTGVVLLGASLMLGGLDLHVAFTDQLARASGSVLLSPYSLSFQGAALAIQSAVTGTALAPATGQTYIVASTQPHAQSALWVTMLALAFFLLWRTRQTEQDRQLASRVLGIWTLLVAFGPLAWVHYLMGPILLLPHLFTLLPKGQALRVTLGIAIAFSWPLTFSDIWIVPGLHLATAASIAALVWLFASLMASPVQGAFENWDQPNPRGRLAD